MQVVTNLQIPKTNPDSNQENSNSDVFCTPYFLEFGIYGLEL